MVAGSAAGAVPPVIGYAAATGTVRLPALWLFLIVFLWTPPHFWALALLLKDGTPPPEVPMLPVVRGDRETVRRILGYTLALIVFTTVPFGLGTLGVVYAVSALVLGGLFVALALRLRRGQASRRDAALLFHYSLLYLALLFVAAAVDVAIFAEFSEARRRDSASKTRKRTSATRPQMTPTPSSVSASPSARPRWTRPPRPCAPPRSRASAATTGRCPRARSEAAGGTLTPQTSSIT